MFRLKALLLLNNSLVGKNPANLSYYCRLTILTLGYNKLIGSIPLEFVSLYKLKGLALHKNNLTGTIPHFLRNITSQEIVSLSYNSFRGNIPDSLGQWKELKYLAIAGNNLSSAIPSFIYNFSLLVVFSMSQNQIHGSLPPSLGLNFPNLILFQTSQNFFNRSIAISLSNTSKLKHLQILKNNFFGKLFVNFESMKNHLVLNLRFSNLGTGDCDEKGFMNYLANCTELQVLNLGRNRLRETLPYSITNLLKSTSNFGP